MTLFGSLESMVASKNGRARFVLCASLLAIVPSLLVFGVLVALGIDTLQAPTRSLNPAFMAYSALLAPVIETAVMLALAAVLAHLIPKYAALQIVLLAFVTALAHRIGGDWRQVVDIAWPILVYAMSLVLWLRRSASDAFIVTTIVHALYNMAFFAVGILGPLAMSDG
jgi:membrane protease YdiL (CAAX protease family)